MSTRDVYGSVVALCLRRLAQAPHHPWGVVALQPHAYSDIPATKMVHYQLEYSYGCGLSCFASLVTLFFFIVLFFVDHMWDLITRHPSCVTGLDDGGGDQEEEEEEDADNDEEEVEERK